LIEYFHFGFKESVADSLWLRWIQDNDYCQTYIAPVQKLKAEPTNINDLTQNPRFKICDNSWSFKMLDAVTRLDPRFKMPYEAGGITLSVMVEDFTGAKTIFDRGVENYPNDWLILYRAAYHYQFDQKDVKKAAELLERAADHGGQPWFKLLAAKLYSKTGQAELGITTLEGLRKTLTDEKEIATVDKRLAELRRELSREKAKSSE
jgi:hypothetical protein